ncbi:MAG: hypothetical protein JST26_07210 [Bacteroidetes bacterium]|nr:hypothetical protein [Bacteroidota bacterium]
MSRTADYTIQGFIYQFIITLQTILESSDPKTEIVAEGVIEDIDVLTPIGIEAIQCKYHEGKDKFTLSAIYKPVLQMMCHFQKNPTSKIKYRLYAHFPNETVGDKVTLTKTDIKTILGTEDKNLKKYIAELTSFKDTDGFIERFEMEYGASLEDSQKAVVVALSKEGFSTEDAEEIFFPNAIHRIAELSIKHNEAERKITKSDFVANLKEKKKTAISRWTKELQSFEKLLKKRREQLRENLNKNLRERVIVLDSEFIKDFSSKSVQLIEEFVNKYNSKIKLHQSPLISIISDDVTINDIWKRLNSKSISVERGLIAGEFDAAHFLRKPLKEIKESKTEFKVRLCSHNADFEKVLLKAKFDDLFIISDKDFDFEKSLKDTTIERIETTEVAEIKYLLSLTNSI